MGHNAERIKRMTNNIIRYCIYFLVFSLLLSFFIPVIYAVKYAGPAADDFTFAQGWIDYSGNHIMYLWENMVNKYLNWQGTYTGMTICAIPIYYLGGLPLLHSYLRMVVFSFFIVLLIMNISFLIWVGVNKKSAIMGGVLLLTLSLILIVGINDLSEVFYWYTGTGVYTVPLICGIASVVCWLQYSIYERKTLLFLGVLLAIVGVGGSLNVSSLVCSILLIGIVYKIWRTHKIDCGIVIGGVAFIGAIVNAVAPGNMIRHSVITDSSIHVGDSVFLSISYTNRLLLQYTQNGMLPLLFIVAFWFGYTQVLSSKKILLPGVVSMYGYFAVVLTVFPVVLGYGEDNLPGRAVFIIQIAIAIYANINAVAWGIWFRHKYANIHGLVARIVVSGVICASIYMWGYTGIITQLTPYKMIIHMYNGDFERAYIREEFIREQIRISNDADVTAYIYKEMGESWTNIKYMGLEDDSEFWANMGVATFYGKNSVKVISLDEYEDGL